MWTTLRRPRWLVGTVICLALAALFVSLGLWQLRRLDERKDRNTEIRARSSQPVEDVEDVEPPFPYRRVRASGRYDTAAEVLVRARSLDSAPGRWVLTPLVLDDGTAVVVNRGFVPNAVDEIPPPAAGEVAVAGLLLATEERGGIGPRDPDSGVLTELARADVGRIAQQYDRALLPAYLQLLASDDSRGPLPTPLPAPALDEGPHLGYAVQWFLFAGVGLVGWPLLLRRTAREDEEAPAWTT